MGNDAQDRKAAKSLELAESIKEQERIKEKRKFQEEWNKRVEIARDGRQAYETADPASAIKNYKKILTLTAQRYEVPLDRLHPKLFDPGSRVSEGLLISAICFDLAKITDRLNTRTSEADLKLYLRLFVLFSKDMPYEVVATSTLRKYVFYTRGLKHEKHFRETYKQMRKGSCVVATAVYGNVFHEDLGILRRFRDQRIARSPLGRSFIRAYYIAGPVMVRILELLPILKRPIRVGIQLLVNRLRTNQSK